MRILGLIQISLGVSRAVPKPGEDEMERWESKPKGMMRFYQDQKYDLGQSIADLVDNCYDAGASKIDVTIGLVEDESYVRILDDGRGMTMAQLSKAMGLGVEQDRSETDLGVFGIGMKLSSLAQANQVTVRSVKGGKFSVRRIDATWIKENNQNLIFKHHLAGSQVYETSNDKMIEEGWSTMVLLEDIHGEKRFVSYDREREDSMLDEISKVRTHLGLTFQRIIQDRRDTSLSLNGELVEPLDPFMSWEAHPRTGTVRFEKRIMVKIDDDTKSAVRVEYVIIPHRPNWKDTRRCRQLHTGYKKANDMQGLYLYRNSRLIEYGSWHGLYGMTNDEHDKCAKILIDIPPQHSTWFGMTPTKTDMQLPVEFMRKVRDDSEKERVWGAIKNGAEMTFKAAASHRYYKEGKAKKKKKATRPTGNKGEGSAGTPVPPVPGKGSRTKPVKPKPVIVSMEEDGDRVVVVLDGKKYPKQFKQLVEYLRMWKP